MGATDEVRLPFQFQVREIRRLAPGESPPEAPHAEALGPHHHHFPMRIEFDPSPELDAILSSLDPPEIAQPTQPATPTSLGGPDGLGWGIPGRRRRAMRAAPPRTPRS